MFKILLIPTWGLAQNLNPEATVEAEYGNNVFEGTICTLAHHVEKYRNNPAPCNTIIKPLPNDSTIVVSHIDLDTIGGCLALMNQKPEHQKFWQAAEFVDLNGPHHIYKYPEHIQDYFNAYWAWSQTQGRAPRYTEITDVTEIILKHGNIIQDILNNNQKLINSGKNWAIETQQKVENCLIEESKKYRLFATDDVFCAASYFSPVQNVIVPITITFNTRFKAITIATNDQSINCKNIVQSFWGSKAGGHNGIAGSPRGQVMTLNDLTEIINIIKKL